MEIISAQPEHFTQIYALICELENEVMDRAMLQEIYLRNLKEPDIVCLIALDNGAAAGFASVHIQYLLHHAARIAELQEIVVAKQYQGRGVGSLLFSEIKKAAAAADCLQLEVCCNRKRTDSHRFYQKQGMAASHFKFTMALDTKR
ncbi:MAG: GNAT family N-acetyltransferase [Clostridium sp.]|nr:GNAT family N-acetyltransferase [Clostridium sp.]